MMAFDRLPPVPSLEPETVEALRSVLVRSIRRGNHEADVRDVLRKTAAEARTKGIHAERLLIILKDLWYSLPELAAPAPSDVEKVLLQELVSRCIEEYYAP